MLIRSTYRLAGVGITLSGCVMILIIGASILLGLFLDKTLGSTKHLYTFILILISIPVNVVALIWVVRYTTKRFSTGQNGMQKINLQEDDNSVGS